MYVTKATVHISHIQVSPSTLISYIGIVCLTDETKHGIGIIDNIRN